MSKIALLSDLVIDQISAGEVVEHPAAVVKELIENSIDAGASEICVDIEGGGLQRIVVDDNGCGMGREDALLCLRRHTTSKLRAALDLQSLCTMGFRGEALASLASVSQLELKSFDGVESTRIVAHGGEIEKVEACARNQGTTIEARSLFFNAPARLKFQKSPAACAAAILKAVQTSALAYPDIRFRLRSNGKSTLDLAPNDWRARSEEVLGPFAHELQRHSAQYSVHGLLGRPEEGKANRSGQVLFVNRRPIFSPLLAKAVKEGFGTRMQEALFPIFVLFLQSPPDLIDVNVHPQKKEVRFSEERAIYVLIRDAVAQGVGTSVSIAPMPWEFQAPVDGWRPTLQEIPFALQESPLPFCEGSSERRGAPKALIGSYLLIEGDDWKLVDIRGARARILFEQMSGSQPAVQPLIWPLEVAMNPYESPEEMIAHLKEMHIEARWIAKHTLALDALPAELDPSQAIALVRQWIAETGSRRLAAALTKTCRSCERSISFEEASLIWQKLFTCADQTYDPLGRKIAIQLTKEQIAELFH